MGSWWLSSHWSGDRVVNDLQHTTLAFTCSGGRLDRPDPLNRLVMSSPSTNMFYFDRTVLLNLHLQQVLNPYILGARRGWLRVNCIERIGISPKLRTWNWQRLENLPSARLYWSCIPVSTKANGFPLGTFPTQIGLCVGWWSTGPAKNMHHLWCLQIKSHQSVHQKALKTGLKTCLP